MSDSEAASFPEVATEAIVVVDLIESTATSNLFGWYAVGRGLLRELRALIAQVGHPRGMRCTKSVGDGYLLAFAEPQSAEKAAMNAVEAAFELLRLLEARNRQVPEQRAIHLRCAIHLGEVDVVENDREGPNVSFTFRLEGISRSSLGQAVRAIPAEQFPLRNYVLCSETMAGILERRSSEWKTINLGLFKLKGFSGWHEVFQVLPNAISDGARLSL